MADQKPISFADLMVSAVQSRLCILCQAHDCVDFWKVGNLNHNKAVEQFVDWPKFCNAATALLEHDGCKYYIKEDLRKAS